MSTDEFAGIYFDDPVSQKHYDQLVAAVAAAEQERGPLAQRHKRAEQELDDGSISDEDFRTVDDQYITANNKIADAKRAVDAYLTQNNAYKTR